MANVSFSNVSKRYVGGREALHDISLTIESGEMVFFTGHSGAGKSTLLKLIPAIERPTAGTVLVNGQNVGRMRLRAVPFLRRNIGMVFQDQRLLHDRSVFDNVMLPLAAAGHPPREAAKRVRAALAKVGLLDRERAFPITLSGGEQQRLCIARAVVGRPGVLIADEPTASLDAEYATRIIEIFRDFNQVGVTVLVSTHDQNLIGRYSPRTIVLREGRVVSA